MSKETTPSNKVLWVLLAAIVAVAAFFRFWHLGVPAFRADTILFWELAKRDVPLSAVVTHWFDVSGAIGQMPLAAICMKLYLSATHLAVTPFNVRTPFALFGLLAVPMAYLAGRNLFDRRFGLLLAAFIALNTFAVYHSREAYVYAPILFGYFLYTAGLFDLRTQLLAGRRPGAKSLAFFCAGIVFSCYSQVTGAFIVGTGALYLFWLIWQCRKKFSPQKPPFVPVFLIHAVPVFPLLFVSWGYGALLKQILESASHGAQVNALVGGNAFVDLTVMLLRLSWGTKPAAVALAVVALAGAVIALVRTKDRRLGVSFFFVLFQVAVFLATRSVAQATFEPRYLAGIFPFLAILLIQGLAQLPKMIPGIAKFAPRAGAALCSIGILFYVYPSFVVTQLTGKSVPYWEISRWADANLPKGAPVLIDRWFESWNEMRSHPATNVIYTFTVPNEPLENYLQLHWRDTATNFFGKFPDAAYLQIAKTYFDAPGVGPWTWPQEYFGHHHAITNHAALVLRDWGLSPRGDFYFANTNRIIVDFYYNTREDMLAKFQKSGRPLHWLYGTGWGYENSGPMEMFRLRTQSFIQWRILNDTAQLELVNLAQQPMQATLLVRGLAAAGTKTVECSAGNARQTFPGPQPNSGPPMIEWKIPVTLPPGSTTVTFRDPLWASAPLPLFVENVALQ